MTMILFQVTLLLAFVAAATVAEEETGAEGVSEEVSEVSEVVSEGASEGLEEQNPNLIERDIVPSPRSRSVEQMKRLYHPLT